MYTYILFQLFTLYSLASIILTTAAYHEVIVYQQLPKYALLEIVFMFLTFAGLNALGYYLWDIVRSAYKKIKKENESSFRSNLMIKNTKQNTSPPAYHIVSEFEAKLLSPSSAQHWREES